MIKLSQDYVQERLFELLAKEHPEDTQSLQATASLLASSYTVLPTKMLTHWVDVDEEERLQLAVSNYLTFLNCAKVEVDNFSRELFSEAFFMLPKDYMKDYCSFYNQYCIETYNSIDRPSDSSFHVNLANKVKIYNPKLYEDLDFEERNTVKKRYSYSPTRDIDKLLLMGNSNPIERAYSNLYETYITQLEPENYDEIRVLTKAVYSLYNSTRFIEFNERELICIDLSLTFNHLLQDQELSFPEKVKALSDSLRLNITYEKWLNYYSDKTAYEDLPIEWWSELV